MEILERNCFSLVLQNFAFYFFHPLSLESSFVENEEGGFEVAEGVELLEVALVASSGSIF